MGRLGREGLGGIRGVDFEAQKRVTDRIRMEDELRLKMSGGSLLPCQAGGKLK